MQNNKFSAQGFYKINSLTVISSVTCIYVNLDEVEITDFVTKIFFVNAAQLKNLIVFFRFYIHIYIYIYIYIYIHIYIFIYIYIYIYISIFLYFYLFIYIYIYIYKCFEIKNLFIFLIFIKKQHATESWELSAQS